MSVCDLLINSDEYFDKIRNFENVILYGGG